MIISGAHTERDIAFLERYISDNIGPCSLRWDVSPQKGDTGLDQWFKYFNESGICFLCFFSFEEKKINVEIKELKEKLASYNEDFRSIMSGRSMDLRKT